MGLFSKCCAKTHLPVLYANGSARKLAPRLTEVVVLLKNGEVFTTEYDGYGLGLVDSGQWDATKFVLKSAYAGEKYADLPDSPDEPQQGYFFGSEEIAILAKIPAFASHQAYCDFLSELDEASTAIHTALLREHGAPEGVTWYKAVTCLEAALDCKDMPSNTLAAERYQNRWNDDPLLASFLPSVPLEAIPIAEAYFKEVDIRQAKSFAELAAPHMPKATEHT
jgi:hypothetical protein